MLKGKDDEHKLLKKILSGDNIAMKEFYNNYSGYLSTICSRYISNSDDIKDILQDSFIKIFKSIVNFKYEGAGSLKAWSSRIVVNESLKFLKEKKRLQIVNTPVWDLPEMTEEEADFEHIPTATILKMIQALPDGYRTVFNLYIFEEKSHKEIASILNISENTSASQLHRAKSLLAKQINEYNSIKNRKS